MKKEKDEISNRLYLIEVKDGKREPWRVLAAFGNLGDTKKEVEDAARRASVMGLYREVRTSEWVRKEAAK